MYNPINPRLTMEERRTAARRRQKVRQRKQVAKFIAAILIVAALLGVGILELVAGGIIELVNAFEHHPVNAHGVAFGLIRLFGFYVELGLMFLFGFAALAAWIDK